MVRFMECFICFHGIVGVQAGMWQGFAWISPICGKTFLYIFFFYFLFIFLRAIDRKKVVNSMKGQTWCGFTALFTMKAYEAFHEISYERAEVENILHFAPGRFVLRVDHTRPAWSR